MYNLTPEEQTKLDKFPNPGQGIYQTVTITYGITFLLCQKEG
jgi:hypothetical protein